MEFFKRIKEASSWAGVAALIHAVGALVASGGTDPAAWGTLAAGIAAIVIPEGQK